MIKSILSSEIKKHAVELSNLIIELKRCQWDKADIIESKNINKYFMTLEMKIWEYQFNDVDYQELYNYIDSFLCRLTSLVEERETQEIEFGQGLDKYNEDYVNTDLSDLIYNFEKSKKKIYESIS